jgi:hypothetical protein
MTSQSPASVPEHDLEEADSTMEINNKAEGQAGDGGSAPVQSVAATADKIRSCVDTREEGSGPQSTKMPATHDQDPSSRGGSYVDQTSATNECCRLPSPAACYDQETQSREAAATIGEMSPEDKEASTFRLNLSAAIRAITYVLG